MIPELEIDYPAGSDITIMNTFYQYPLYEDGKKLYDDFIMLVYKINSTQEKKYRLITKPSYTYYIMNDDVPVPKYNQLFIEKDKVHPVTVDYNNLEKSIAELTDNMDFYKTNLQNKNRAGNKLLHSNPKVFMSDMNIEDHYRFKFAQTYTNEITTLSKGFFDIEVDGKWAKGDFVEPENCPVNCVSFCDEKSDRIYVFILRDERNPLIQQFEDDIRDRRIDNKEIHDFVVDNVGGEEKAEKYGLMNTQYSFFFFDDELALLKDLFSTMHRCSPDFIEGWNSSGFDLNFIIERIQYLGGRPDEILCDDNFPTKIVRHFIDKQHQNELAERGDYTFISGLPVFIDQMIQYASRRKAKIGSFKSFKLDDIGLKEAGVKKLDYHYITNSVTELPWLDFKTFVFYNIMDVVVQKCIEKKTQDLEYIFSKCIVNNTTYNKGHRQTVYLINRMANDWYNKGFIIGNNNNRENPKPPKYLGALVGKPLNTNNYSKIFINGKAILVCDNMIDFDFKSLYPSIMGEDNIAPNTQIGKIEIPNVVYSGENAYNIEPDKYSRGGEFIENMITDNFIEYSHRWFHLANIKECIRDIDEFFGGLGYGKMSDIIFNPMATLLPTTRGKSKPVSFNENYKQPRKPLIFYNKRDDSLNYESLNNKKDIING